MQHKDKILEYYQSGRYQCDYQFYINLEELIRHLNLYEWLPSIQGSIQTLKKINKLTQINANCLDEDYNDEEGICQTYKIRSLINSLNTKDIAKIINQCQSLGWQSYEDKITRILTGIPSFSEIIQRIHCNIHCDQLRIDSMLFVAFFYQINGEQLNLFIQTYQRAVQYYLEHLNNERSRFIFLLQAQQYSNIASIIKVKNYVCSIYFIVRTCLRFCSILKILTGQNNLSLKFTVIKKQIQKLMKKYPEWKFQNDKEDILNIIPHFKQSLKINNKLQKSTICRWCFKKLQKQQFQHNFCKMLIKKK